MHQFWKQLNPNFKGAFIIVAILTVWMLSGVFFKSSKEEDLPEQPASPKSVQANIATTEFTPKEYKQTLTLSAQTAARYRTTLSAQTSGRIESLPAEVGHTVQEGDLILTFDAADRRTKLISAKARLAAAQKLADSARKLAKDGYISETTLAEREAQEAEAQSTVDNIKQDLIYTRVTAPISGIIENRQVSTGDFASIGTPLLDIVNRQDLLLISYIPQKERSRVSIGQEISATLITGENITGIVDFIATNADLTTRTYQVNMAVDGRKFPIPTGMSAEVYIPTGHVSAYTIPHNAAILSDEGNLGVMKVENNKAIFTPITILEDTQESLVVSGLGTSTVSLITRGQLSLKDGTEINLTNAE